MITIKQKLHRKVEKKFNLKKGTLKPAFDSLKEKHGYSEQQIISTVQECVLYCQVNKQSDSLSFLTAFNLYVSCLNNPKK